MYPDVFFIDCTYKIMKYNMPLCIFTVVTTFNKFFYIHFIYLRHKGKHLYHWGLSQLYELYTRVGQEKAEVWFKDEDDTLITGLEEIMTNSYHILFVCHINKNVLACKTKFFERPDLVKARMNKWHKLCQAPTFAEYLRA